MQWVDTSANYPTMHSVLPRQTLNRYRQLMFDLGFYPQSGGVHGFGVHEGLSSQDLGEREELDWALELEHRRFLLDKLGLSDMSPEDLQLVEQSPCLSDSLDAPYVRRGDPQPLNRLSEQFIHRHGWQRFLSLADVGAHWSDYVGLELAAHCRIESYSEGRLTIRTDSTAWATQMKWLLPTLEKRLAGKLGSGVVRQVIIRGPVVPSWKHGRFSVPGRGPRDTYG